MAERVLIVTYYWPPRERGIQRWLKFAKYLPKHN